MDALLKRWLWIGPLLLGTAVTYFVAATLTQAVAAYALPLDKTAVTPPTHKVALVSSAAPVRHVDGKVILENNPFDSVTGPILDLPPPPPVVVDTTTVDPNERMFQPCPGATKLLITVVDPVQPKRSFALLSTGEGSANKPMVREGVPAAGRTAAVIVRERVYFQEGATYCYIGMFQPPQPVSAAPVPPPVMAAPPPPASGGSSALAGLEKGIQRVDDTHFNVERNVVEQIIERQADLMRMVRIAPVQEEGKTVGVQLLNIRPDTLLGKLGMQAGDLLKTINGFEMTSPEQALQAYGRLRSAEQITVGMVRNGKPTNIEFNIK